MVEVNKITPAGNEKGNISQILRDAWSTVAEKVSNAFKTAMNDLYEHPEAIFGAGVGMMLLGTISSLGCPPVGITLLFWGAGVTAWGSVAFVAQANQTGIYAPKQEEIPMQLLV